MSNPISALGMAGFDGLARVEDCGLQGMITLRGDLGAKPVKAAATAATGAKIPGKLAITQGPSGSLAWMSPDELLVLCAHDQAGTTRDAMIAKLGTTPSLAVDVSDARVMLQVHGPTGAVTREIMAKLCPLDLSPEGFQPGTIRRTRMAQIPAAIWMHDETTFRVICFRSVAEYAFQLLKTAAQSETGVGYFR